MSRFLFVVPPLTGHTLPLTALARILVDRGHDVAWVAHEGLVGHLLPDDATRFPTEIIPTGEEPSAEGYQAVRGAGAFQRLIDGLVVPAARAMVPAVEDAAGAFQPDFVVVEQLAWGGALAARRLGLPWGTVAASFGTRRFVLRWLPPVCRWVDERWEMLQEELDLEPVPEPEASPLLNLVLTSRAFVGPGDPWEADPEADPEQEAFPATFHFVGPVTERGPDPTPFPWDALEPGPSVLVSLGSVESVRGGRFYAAVAEGLRDLEARVVVVAPEEFGPFPDDWIVRTWVPQLELLRRVDAVVTHGGMNTVHEALAEGLPLVVAPIVNDQGYIAQRVEAAGAGVRISFGRARPDEIRDAVERALHDDDLRGGAARLARSFSEAGGSARAADLLEAAATAGDGA